MSENLANHQVVVDESDDSHLTAALRADQRQHFIDARQEQRPDVSRGLAMGWSRCHLVWRTLCF